MRIGRTLIRKSKKFTFRFDRIHSNPTFSWIWTCGFLSFIQLNLITSGRQRNWPCPCGSGKKFKKCCQPYAYMLIAGIMVRPKSKKKRKVNRKQLYRHPERHYTGRKTLNVE